MRAALAAGNLMAALSLVAPLARDKITRKIPILGAVALTARPDGAVSIRICTCTFDVDLTLSIAAEVEEAGTAAVSAKTLRALVAGVPKGTSLTITVEGKVAVVESDGSRFELPLFPIDELPPPLELVGETGRAVIARKDALALFTRPLFAVSTETTRYYLNGLLLHNDAVGNLCSVGTDGHRLAKVVVNGAGELSPDHSCIVPSPSVRVANKLLGAHRDVGQVTLRKSRSLIEIAGGSFRLTSKLIDGIFPDYERVIASAGGGKNTVTIGYVDLAAALARVAAASGTTRMAAAGLEWEPGQAGLRICAVDDGAVHDVVAVKAMRGQGRVAIQARHGLGAMKALGRSATVSIDAGALGGVPVIITGDEAEVAGFSIIQMPMWWPRTAAPARASA
jgi:DNA polymerase III subunit beta